LQRILDRKGRVAILGEIKRASPSKGIINGDIDAAEQAMNYAKGGCVAISVLTEPHWFKGTIEDLRAVSSAVGTLPAEERPAVLLKDFVVDEWQLLQGRASGADLALLIVALLPEDRLTTLLAVSRELGMEPLVEVATVDEMKVALKVGAKLIGINNRNLHTFTVDNNNTITIMQTVPPEDRANIAIIALSGIKTREDVVAFTGAGAQGVLVLTADC
jgi:anthranilate synthase/indole-3-glycerol phosphate synthase/phosphoribosylanthranilate isomerase